MLIKKRCKPYLVGILIASLNKKVFVLNRWKCKKDTKVWVTKLYRNDRTASVVSHTLKEFHFCQNRAQRKAVNYWKMSVFFKTLFFELLTHVRWTTISLSSSLSSCLFCWKIIPLIFHFLLVCLVINTN